MIVFNKIIIGITGLMSLYSSLVFADPASDNYASGAQAANTARQTALNKLKQFDPLQLPRYNPNPAETQYVTNPNAIARDVASKAETDPGVQAASVLIKQGRQVQVNPNSPAIQRSRLAQTDAANITQGTSSYCKQPICSTTWQTISCESHNTQKVPCTANLSVIVTPATQSKPFSGTIQALNAHNGTFLLPQGTLTNFHLTMKSGNVWRCNTGYSAFLNGERIQSTSVGCGNSLGDLSFHNNAMSVKSDGKTPINFNLQGPAGGAWSYASWSGTMTVPSHAEEDSWSGNCESLGQRCSIISNQCTQKSATRTINNIPVTRECWQKSYQLQCGSSGGADTCQPYLGQGCTQITPNQVSCPTTTCSQNTQNACGKPTFCMNGDCYKSDPKSNANFGKAGSQMAAAVQAANQAKDAPNSPVIFAGQALRCNDKALGLITCCNDRGWINQTIPGLVSCSEEEKKLGVAREQGKTISLGRYCAEEILGVCLRHKQSFCVFDSLLAFDVQAQGRGGQLRISFGNAENPNCRGMTVTELQAIDFSKIDFSNFYSSLQQGTTFPDKNVVQDRIRNNIPRQVGGLTNHENEI